MCFCLLVCGSSCWVIMVMRLLVSCIWICFCCFLGNMFMMWLMDLGVELVCSVFIMRCLVLVVVMVVLMVL